MWFLQPNEAQFFLAAETLKFKPKPFAKTKNPFTPKQGRSPQITPASSNPSLYMFKMASDDGSNGSARTLAGSTEHGLNFASSKEAWANEEIIQTFEKKGKNSSFRKVKNFFRRKGKR